MSYYNEA
jgi:hypothetical protein